MVDHEKEQLKHSANLSVLVANSRITQNLYAHLLMLIDSLWTMVTMSST